MRETVRKKNYEGRALTLEQVPVFVERGQRLGLISLLFEVQHLGSPCLRFVSL